MAGIIVFGPLTLIFFAIVIGLLVHHAWTHDGHPAHTKDFQNGMTGLFSSHEGWIIAGMLIMVGIAIGVMI